MREIKSKKIVDIVGSGSLGGFILLLFMLLVPCATKNVSAEASSISSNDQLSIALSPNVDMTFLPDDAGVIEFGEADLRISAGMRDGYTAYIAPSSDSSSLVNIEVPDAEIKATVNDAMPDQLEQNTWGFALISGNETEVNGREEIYRGLKSEEMTLTQTEVASNDHYKLSLAAKVDSKLPSGQYTTEFTISVVPNPLKATNLSDMTYMQEMTSTLCQNTPSSSDYRNPVTKRLIDLRDKKQYWVAKLADGNCWMTQNLALDINAEKGLTSADTDLNGMPNGTGDETGLVVWRKGNTGVDTLGQAKVAPSSTINNVNLSDSFTATGSVNLGDWVLTVPKLQNNSICKVPDLFTLCYNFDNVVRVGEGTDYPNATYQAQKGSYRFRDGQIANETIRIQTGGLTQWFDTDNIVTVNKDVSAYDPHYLIGNYYQWNTATAGSGGNLMNGEARDSICPRGWKIPNNGNGIALLSKYGLSDRVYNGDFHMSAPPLYYLRGGKIVNSLVFGAASIGGYWISELVNISIADSAKFLAINSTSVNISGAGYRYEGFSVRCLAR